MKQMFWLLYYSYLFCALKICQKKQILSHNSVKVRMADGLNGSNICIPMDASAPISITLTPVLAVTNTSQSNTQTLLVNATTSGIHKPTPPPFEEYNFT